jgi:hypothetical protein
MEFNMTDKIQYNLFSDPLQQLVDENTRSDDWVNATKWCDHFGTRWSDISKQPTFDRFLKALASQLFPHSDKKSLYKVSGKPKQVWVHPLVAIKLAEWLSPEFDIFVKQIFRRYLDADITLADDILQRNNSDVDAKWISQRAEGKLTRKAFTNELKTHGVVGIGFGMNTNAIYEPLFGMNAQELKESRMIKRGSAREGMSSLELAAVNLAELSAIERIKKTGANGNKPTSEQSRIASSKVKDAIADVM